MKKTPSFEETNWSVVAKAGRDSLGPIAEEALVSLCQSYWYPIYFFARRNYEKSHEEAEDLTQGFLSSFISGGSLRSADSSKGKFRSFLLASFENFVRKEIRKQSAQKRGGDKYFVPIDFHLALEKFSEEGIDGSTPSKMFDKKWAENIFNLSLRDLRSEYAAKGKLPVYDRLSPFLPGDGTNSEAPTKNCQATAGELKISKGALRVELHRMRTRFRNLVTAYVAQTVESHEDVDAELRYLCQLFV